MNLPNTDTNEKKEDRQFEKKKEYVDDITMYMSWQNHCWNIHMCQIIEQHRYYWNQWIQQANNNQQQQSNQQQANEVNNQQQQIVKLASMKKRFAAEIIDFFILAMIKVFVIQLLYGEEYLERFTFEVLIDNNTSFTDFEWMILQAVLFRFVIIGYEAFMLAGTIPFSKGYTIGKFVLGIKVVFAENIEAHEPEESTVRINSVAPLGALRSCARSLLKNASISFMFPTVPLFLFSYNRLIYDTVVHSIVIEKT